MQELPRHFTIWTYAVMLFIYAKLIIRDVTVEKINYKSKKVQALGYEQVAHELIYSKL